MPVDVKAAAISNADERDVDSLLFPSHLDHLLQSAIPRDFILQRGYRTVTDQRQLEALGFRKQQCHVPGILIPLHGVNGDGIVGYQFRPDSPRLNNRGKKYLGMQAFCLKRNEERVFRIDRILEIREGHGS